MPKVPLAVKIAVPIVGLLLTIGAAVVGVGVLKAWWSLPFGSVQVSATQPIEFPHDLHVAAQIDCLFCHRTALESEAASLPAVQQCYFCHQVVKKDSPEVAKILHAFENNEPINWVRVHRLPDHVQFVHDAHVRFFSEKTGVAPSQTCATCHGNVGEMTVAVQVRNLKMRDCVDCHRGGYLTTLTALSGSQEAELKEREAIRTGATIGPPTDCSACHY